MEFGVLGQLVVHRGEGPVEVRGAKERLLLAQLVARVGRPVPVTELIVGLWGDAPPRTAAKSLQTYVLRLRNALEPTRSDGPTVLVTEGQGYRLAAEPRQVDAERFVRLLAAAEDGPATERLATLRQALDLWRGPAYVGLGQAPVLAAEATRLEGLRLGALEDRAALEIELGRRGAALGELERLVAEQPLRERGWALLMTGLYREGRQADALAAFERARRVLADELGIDPGSELRSVHARVLAQDPTLGAASGGRGLPPRLSAPSTPLRGRDRELALLREEWRAARGSRPRTVLLRGPAGSGAHRLVTALAEEVVAEGFAVHHLSAEAPDGGSGAWSSGRACLVVLDEAVSAGRDLPPGLVVRLAGPDAEPVGADAVVDLRPLDHASLRALVADRVAVEEVEEATAQVRGHSQGWPGRAHVATGAWLRAVASASVRTAAVEAEASRASHHEARARLASGVLDLQYAESGAPDPRRCPWPGLEPYDVGDGAWYAGRERLVAELVARFSGASFLAVVGASGSGKSSAVRAGLLAALVDDQLPGSAGWNHLLMRPGAHPLRELAQRVLGARGPDAGAVLERLVRNGPDASGRTVLVVDQFEEVWTACGDEGERAAFLDTLADVVADESASVGVVVALRADYLDRVADHPRLAALVGDNAVLVGAPTPDDVRRAVERPATRAGLELDDGLADAVVEDAGHEPGLLPLLSTSMARLWGTREGRRLTFGGYVAVGGLRGAIGHLAEEAYGALDEGDREAARSLLLRLTGPGEGSAVVRRRVALAELAGLPGTGADQAHEVVERLAGARLLTVSEDHVEVAHEALFREWPRLRGWLAEDAAGRAVQRRLAVAAGEWEAEERDPVLLWRGSRLVAGLEVAAARPDEVTGSEQAFLDAGAAVAEAERAEAERRAEAEARTNRRLRTYLVGVAVLLALALLAGLVALVARQRAAEAADEAERQATAADARRLAASALNVEYPDLALLTAVEATRREQSPETYGALLTLLARQPDVVTSFRTPHRFLRDAVSPDGETVYVSENEPVLHALDAETGDPLWRVDLAGQAGSISPSPDGDVVAVVVFAGERHEVVMLDPADGDVVARVEARDFVRAIGKDSPPYLGYNSGWIPGDRFVAGNDLGVFLADDRGRVLGGRRWPEPQPDPLGLTVWPDGRVSGTQAELGASTVIDLDRPRARVLRTRGWIAAVSPGGHRVLEVESRGEAGAAARLLDGRTLEQVGETWPLEGVVTHAAFSPDGEQVALGLDAEVLLRDGRTFAPRAALAGHSGSVMSVAWAGSRNDLMWTAGRDGRAVGFDTTGRRGVIREVPLRDRPHSGESSDSGAVVFSDYNDTAPNRAYLRPADADRARRLPVGVPDCLCQAQTTELTPDGATAAVGYLVFAEDYSGVEKRGYLVLHDGSTGKITDVVRTPWPVAGLGSTPDGRRLVISGDDGWGVLDLATGELSVEEIASYEVPSADGTALVEVAPDGDRAVLLRGEDIVVVDPSSREVLMRRTLSEEGHRGLSASWAGTELVVGTLEGWLYVLDADSLEDDAPRRLITGGFVTDVETSQDGGTAATIGSDGDVLLWDTATWRPYGEPVLDDRGWGFLTFSQDSSSLVVEYENAGRATVDVLAADWVGAACAAANRELTADENAIVRPGEPARPTCT